MILLALLVGVPLGLAWMPFDRHLRRQGVPRAQRELAQAFFTLALMLIGGWTIWIIVKPN